MDSADVETLLRRFGLSEKEVDTYLTILELGEAKASTVSDEAGTSKRYVYSIAEELEERGFVEVNDHAVPTTIRARPPEEVRASLTDDVEEMAPALETYYSQPEAPTQEFEVVKSRVTVLKRLSQFVSRAESEITLAVPATHLDAVREDLRDAVERGVFVLLLVSDADPGADADLDGVASVARVWEQPMPTMLTVDQSGCVVAPSEMLARSNSDEQAIAFEQPQLGPVIVGSFLGNYFPMASEVYTTARDDLPATYVDFRNAVLQATLHRREGDGLRVTVEGHFVRDPGDAVTLDGRVVEVRQSLLEPATNSFPVETSLVVETDDGDVHTVGGQGSFVEDVEADEATLYWS
ncbi:hypothetical protein GCM10009037_23810 [Halarchaeum grantii]|uniref:Transcriptional regulator n=1 Tax=Halarchaeum grantii TaxID=1193105 RepID=A0A830FBY7_9EURY|nr:TrmB family transcriptional regulator sugar-binding domain-containing protein [Halarchaeum grantii]GGL39308.1 hypothetical protein GCM10009037_23810 [Halarchaeum grantii]